MEQLNSKVLLFGEYAVLHEGMALVVPCEKYQGSFGFCDSAENKAIAQKSNKYLKNFCAFVASHMGEEFVLEVKLFEKEIEEGLFFNSNIPQGYGLGSSGALVAAIVLRYLKKAKGLKDDLKALTLQKLYTLKSELGRLESFFHGVSSGLDPLSIILNQPILFKNKKEIQPTEMPKANGHHENVIFLLDTLHGRSTFEMMKKFETLHQQPAFRKAFKKEVVHYNNLAIEHLLQNRLVDFYESLGHLSRFQINEMPEFIPLELHSLVQEGLDSGDYFMKLCGAGGGGFLLGFTSNWTVTQEKLKPYRLEEVYAF